MVDETTERELKASINEVIFQTEKDTTLKVYRSSNLQKPKIIDVDFQTIKVQFRALGLITKSDKKRSIKDNQTYWTLTNFGDQTMVKLRALKK